MAKPRPKDAFIPNTPGELTAAWVGHALRDLAVQQQQSTMKEFMEKRKQEASKGISNQDSKLINKDENEDDKFRESMNSLFDSICPGNNDQQPLEPNPILPFSSGRPDRI